MLERSIALASLLAIVAFLSVSAAAAEAPTIAEWVNQNVRMRQAAQALDQPSADGKSLGGIMAGAEIKAIGIVAGGQWVQIELPNKALAYVPKSAVDLGGAAAPAPSSAVAAPAPPAAPAPSPAPASPQAAPTAAAPAPANPQATPASIGGAQGSAISGAVDKVPNAATLVVGDHRVRLWGIDPGPENIVAPFDTWLRQHAGTLKCDPVATTGRYKCLTADGHDVAEVALFSGFARVGEGATSDYRNLEDQARDQHHGLWAQQ
jgi:endonuclease YncB( thermonuclease family)